MEERKAKGGGFCGAIEVSGDRCSADLSWGRQRATRASVPSNVLESSLTLRSVALHLPIVASRLVPEQRLLSGRLQRMWDSATPPKIAVIVE